jgi:hypothetical protein
MMVSEKEEQKEKKKKKKKEEPSSMFQRQRVDMLLGELGKKYPPHIAPPLQHEVKGELIQLWFIFNTVEPVLNDHSGDQKISV